MKKIIIIIVLIMLTSIFTPSVMTAQQSNDTYIKYYKDYEEGKFLNLFKYWEDVENRLSYYKVFYNNTGVAYKAEKYVSGSLTERIHLYENGYPKIKEVYNSPKYSENIFADLHYKTDESPYMIYYYDIEGDLITTSEMNEYLYSRTRYQEGHRAFYSEFYPDNLFILPDFLFEEKLIRGIAKRSNSYEVLYDNENKIQRVEEYKVFTKLRRKPVYIYDFKYNKYGRLSRIDIYTFSHGKIYRNYEYRYTYDDFGKVSSRKKIHNYNDLEFIDEVMRYRYDGGTLVKVSLYKNTKYPFEKEKTSDSDFRISYDSYYDYNSLGEVSLIRKKEFVYGTKNKDVAINSVEHITNFEYDEKDRLNYITEDADNKPISSIYIEYDRYNNIAKKDKIYYKDIRNNTSISYYYYDNGKGPLYKIVRESEIKKQKYIEYYISEEKIRRLEIYYNETLAGILEFNFAGDIITEVKYGNANHKEGYEYYNQFSYYENYDYNNKVKRVEYQYYDNGSVHSAMIYLNDIPAKKIYFAEGIPFLYGDIVRIDMYSEGLIYISKFYFLNMLIKSIVYDKEGKILNVIDEISEGEGEILP